MGTYNSSELSARIAKKLNMNQEEGLKLYKELSQMENGPVKDALNALCVENPVQGTAENPTKKYVAVIKDSCVRDTQYAVRYDVEVDDDDAWRDANGVEIFLGFVEAETPVRAKHIAAVKEDVDDSIIEIYPV